MPIFKQELKPCKICGDLIGTGRLADHQRLCSKRSPEERDSARKARNYARRKVRGTSVAVSNSKVAQVPRRHTRHHSLLLNGSGRRLSATISLDFKILRRLILELAPHLSIDKVEVL